MTAESRPYTYLQSRFRWTEAARGKSLTNMYYKECVARATVGDSDYGVGPLENTLKN